MAKIQKKKLKKNKKHKRQKITIVKKKWINKNNKNKRFKKLPKRRYLKYLKQITYILNITFFRRNTFFVVTDLKGEIKLYLTCGQAGFKGKDKMAFMAITETTQKFLRLIWLAGMRRLIVKYKGYHIVRRAFKKGFKAIRKEHKFSVIAFLAIISRAFNGCRHNKQRRL